MAKSNIVNRRLSAPAIATMLAAVEQRQASPVLYGGGLVLDAAGGAINRAAPDATAYIHRRSLATMQYSAGWADSSTGAGVAANPSMDRGRLALDAAVRVKRGVFKELCRS